MMKKDVIFLVGFMGSGTSAMTDRLTIDEIVNKVIDALDPA